MCGGGGGKCSPNRQFIKNQKILQWKWALMTKKTMSQPPLAAKISLSADDAHNTCE